MIIRIVLLLLNTGCFLTQEPVEKDFCGEYLLVKKELVQRYSCGWSEYKIYHRELTLMSDKTYTEVNTSGSAFDYPDSKGTWEVQDGKILLMALDGNQIKHIEIVNNHELKILDEDYLMNEILVKQ